VDFWVKSQGDKLVIMDARIHKYPTKMEGEWVRRTVESSSRPGRSRLRSMPTLRRR
jgi:hypothetical protein